MLDKKIPKFKKLQPYRPSVAAAVAEGMKYSATAVDLRPLVNPCSELGRRKKELLLLLREEGLANSIAT